MEHLLRKDVEDRYLNRLSSKPTSRVFFTANTHFGDRSIAFHRGFGSPEDMDQVLIENWNSLISPGDIVYHLGNFALLGKARIKEVVEKLNGSILLVPGNHDCSSKKLNLYKKLFTVLPLLHILRIGQVPVTLCHYPLLQWYKFGPSSCHFYANLYGHYHTYFENKPALDVGVDSNSLMPFSWGDILYYLGQREVEWFPFGPYAKLSS